MHLRQIRSLDQPPQKRNKRKYLGKTAAKKIPQPCGKEKMGLSKIKRIDPAPACRRQLRPVWGLCGAGQKFCSFCSNALFFCSFKVALKSLYQKNPQLVRLFLHAAKVLLAARWRAGVVSAAGKKISAGSKKGGINAKLRFGGAQPLEAPPSGGSLTPPSE